jgi:hypothetical protein
MATERQGEAVPETEERSVPEKVKPWLFALLILDKFVDRFGVSLLVLLLILGVVWRFGDERTKNDFVRELLFQETTKKPWVTCFFLVLLGVNLFGRGANVSLFRRWTRTERKRVETETDRLNRVAQEKSRLQEEILGAPLSHTDRDRVSSSGKRLSTISTTAQGGVDDEATVELGEASERGTKR